MRGPHRSRGWIFSTVSLLPPVPRRRVAARLRGRRLCRRPGAAGRSALLSAGAHRAARARTGSGAATDLGTIFSATKACRSLSLRGCFGLSVTDHPRPSTGEGLGVDAGRPAARTHCPATTAGAVHIGGRQARFECPRSISAPAESGRSESRRHSSWRRNHSISRTSSAESLFLMYPPVQSQVSMMKPSLGSPTR